MIALSALFALAATLGLVWAIGARESVFSISAGEPAWFIAVRSDQPPRLAPGVRAKWACVADFAFIGADEAYWRHFMIAVGGDHQHLPIIVEDDTKDAYVARIRLRTPPRLALGLLKLLVAVGLLPKPRGETMRDASHTGLRADAMPSADAITRLHAQRADYAPAMVNFLAYRRPDGRALYRRYGMVALRTVYRTGGRLLFYGAVDEVMRDATVGPTAGRWDEVAAMHYPNPHAILSMEHIPEYRAALAHRDTGLERTVVIASTQN
ncbi:MAG: hypothetical protein R3C25_08610 [Hyphomonadaceae bacterium]